MTKRGMDILGACVGLILFSPLLLMLWFLIRRDMGAPVLFRQVRPGRDGRPFEMVKFRSMKDAHGPDGTPLPDSERITPLGRKLRSSSADELPELWNVLKGEMSLVGPRPLLMEYLPYYRKEERLRQTVRPGITGWSQIYGRNTAPWDDRLAGDTHYVRNRTFWLDLRIIFKTVEKVFRRDGVVTDPRSIMQDLDKERCSDVVIRKLETAETDAAADLIQSVYNLDHYRCTMIPSPHLARFFAEKSMMQDDFQGVFREGRLIGVMQLRDREDDVHLNNFAVAHEEQGWGVSDLMMRNFHQAYPEKAKTLFVDSRNPRARKFYERYGYVLEKAADMVEVIAGKVDGPPLLSVEDVGHVDQYGIGYLTGDTIQARIGYVAPDRLMLPQDADCSVLELALGWRSGSRICMTGEMLRCDPSLVVDDRWEKLEMRRR